MTPGRRLGLDRQVVQGGSPRAAKPLAVAGRPRALDAERNCA